MAKPLHPLRRDRGSGPLQKKKRKEREFDQIRSDKWLKARSQLNSTGNGNQLDHLSSQRIMHRGAQLYCLTFASRFWLPL